MMRSPLALLVALLPLSVSAQTIYKCIDASGGTVISNSRVEKNCKAISTGPENAVPAPPRAKPASAVANPSPAGFPRVQEDTQKARDGDRRHILEQELAGEQRSLAVFLVTVLHPTVIASDSMSATFRRFRKSWATSGSRFGGSASRIN